jgi:hypothetical protein
MRWNLGWRGRIDLRYYINISAYGLKIIGVGAKYGQ